MDPVITGISSMATRRVLESLSRRYEESTGVGVAIRSMGGVDAARLVRDGEATDIVVLASGPMAALEKEGRLVRGSVVGFACSGIAIAIPAGARRPEISDEAAVRRAVREAGRVCYSTGPSGDHLLRLCKRWGVMPDSADCLVKAPPGVPVGDVLARGGAELGFQQLSEMLHVPGIEIVGPLPLEIQSTTVFSAGIASVSAQTEEAARLLAFLTTSETADAKRQQGLEPPPDGPAAV